MYLWLYRVYGRRVLRVKERYMHVIFSLAHIETFTRYPENDLGKNSEIALNVTNRIFDTDEVTSKHEIDSDQVDKIEELIRHNPEVVGLVTNAYLLDHFYYSHGYQTEFRKKEAEKALLKAKAADPNADILDYNGFSSLNKKIKEQNKVLKLKLRKLAQDKIQREKFSFVGKITITSSGVLFVVGLFSTLFVASGFLYTKIYYSFFGIDVSDFFDVSDYLSVSVSVLASVMISTVIGLVAYAWGFFTALSNRIHSEQFSVEEKPVISNWHIWVILVTCALAVVMQLYNRGEIATGPLYPLALFLVLYVYHNFPVRDYVENPVPVNAFIVTLLIFLIHLGLRIVDDVQEKMNPGYGSTYTLQFDTEREISDHLFIGQNSKYVFLQDNETKSVVVVPVSAVKIYTVNGE